MKPESLSPCFGRYDAKGKIASREELKMSNRVKRKPKSQGYAVLGSSRL